MKYKFNFSLASFGLTIIVMILNIMLILQSKELFTLDWFYLFWMAITVVNLLIACIQKEKE